MKTRTTITAIALMLTATLPGAATAGSHTSGPKSEFSISGEALLPNKAEHWDSAGGVTAQLLLWQNRRLALGLSLGLQEWNAPYEYALDRDTDSTIEFVSEGSVAVMPIGASLIYRAPLAPHIDLLLEAGMRYLLVESDIWIDTYYSDAYEQSHLQDLVQIEDTLAAVFGARIEGALNDQVRIFCGIGYQKDLGKPIERVYGDYLDETDFSACAISFGAAFSF